MQRNHRVTILLQQYKTINSLLQNLEYFYMETSRLSAHLYFLLVVVCLPGDVDMHCTPLPRLLSTQSWSCWVISRQTLHFILCACVRMRSNIEHLPEEWVEMDQWATERTQETQLKLFLCWANGILSISLCRYRDIDLDTYQECLLHLFHSHPISQG